MRNAKRFIHHLYFIWEQDELTAEMTKIMLQKLKEGVEVRIIYDWLGSSTYKKDELKQLEAAGAGVYADFKRLNSVNYRNHRKITVIDAEIGYTGGFNVGQEYIDGGKAYPAWRDTGIRFTGPGVAELEKWFSARWFANTKEELMTEKYLPAAAPELLERRPDHDPGRRAEQRRPVVVVSAGAPGRDRLGARRRCASARPTSCRA